MSDFVNFKLAQKLKDKGYPQHIAEDAYIIDNYGEEKYNIGDRLPIPFVPDYMADVAAPTISQVLKWLRDEKKIHICIDIYDDGWFFDIASFYKEDTGVYEIKLPYKSSKVTPDYDSFEQAALAGVNYCLENLI
mgnify:CR=1 FL=1